MQTLRRCIALCTLLVATATPGFCQFPENLSPYWIAFQGDRDQYFRAAQFPDEPIPQLSPGPEGPYLMCCGQTWNFDALLGGGLRDYFINFHRSYVKAEQYNAPVAMSTTPNSQAYYKEIGYVLSFGNSESDWWSSDAANPGPLGPDGGDQGFSPDHKQRHVVHNHGGGSSFGWTAPDQPGTYWITCQIKTKAYYQTYDREGNFVPPQEEFTIPAVTRRINIIVVKPEDYAAAEAALKSQQADAGTTWVSDELGFSLTLPEGWEQEADAGDAEADFSPTGRDDALVSVIHSELQQLNQDQVTAAAEYVIGQMLPGATVVPDTIEELAIRKCVGTSLELTGQHEGQQYRSFLYVVSSGNSFYVVLGLVNPATGMDMWEETKQVVQSFAP